MANIKSAKKRAKQSEKNRIQNLSRKTAIKTAVKKVLVAIDKKTSIEETQALLSDVAAKLARAKGKNLIHRNTASRKLSRLAKRVNKFVTEQSAQA
ncbi:30S ribosomal protein S20 [Candidatus Babela massiliensis]|uniref:Small ribosomal subunit protein bS20 n=1 Tax=Candidatus Babela massiliensis TaxID=673862 RepID=V6DFJ0_9BACT|nr:30S ribosomal protein S20 [Candidatus Babela massiliensis]CDK30340.1 Ribosomal protein S20 [Candidatus Babela massiliensis]